MNYITITTPDNIEIEYRLSGPGSRIAAAVVDTLIQTLLFISVFLILFYTFLGGNFENIGQLNNMGWAVGIFILLCFLIYFGYYIIFELTQNGQTPGKKLFGLRVIRENGSPISLTQSLIRNLLKFFVDSSGVGIVLIFFSKKCKRVGDMAASTIVVAENSKQVELTSLISVVEKKSNGIYGDNFSLNPIELELLKDYFRRKEEFLDKGASVLKCLIRYFSGKFGVSEEHISESILLKILEQQ